MQQFDRSSFGIGVLTTNRYQPPEHVGDTMPSKANLLQQQGEAAAAQAMAERVGHGGEWDGWRCRGCAWPRGRACELGGFNACRPAGAFMGWRGWCIREGKVEVAGT